MTGSITQPFEVLALTSYSFSTLTTELRFYPAAYLLRGLSATRGRDKYASAS
jgi:hypothetical protein